MNTPKVRRVGALLVLAVLGLALALVPQLFRQNPAAAQIVGGVGASQCLTPVGTGTASVFFVGSVAATFPFVVCTPLPGGVVVTPNPAVGICGIVTAYTPASASTSGTMTVNGVTITIPVGYVPPSYFKVGANVLVYFTVSGNNLVDISPGNCPTPVPLSATAPAGGAGPIRVGANNLFIY
jgi:hypothetical protein